MEGTVKENLYFNIVVTIKYCAMLEPNDGGKNVA